MMDLEFIVGVLVCFVIYSIGLVTGYWMHRAAHKDGVKLMVRVKEDLNPYEEYDEEMVQKTTGGQFEPPFERDG